MTPPPPFPPDAGSSNQPSEERYPFWTYHDLAVFIGLALPCLIAAAVLVKLFSLVLPDFLGGRAATLLAPQFVAYGLWFLCLFALLRLRYARPFWRSLAWVRPDLGLAVFAAAGPLLAIGIVLLGLALRTPEIDMPMKDLLQDRSSVFLVGAFAVTLGPLCEELVFRGFFFPLLARTFGAVIGIVLTALPFAVLHGPQYAWSWRHVLLITLAGTAFGWVRHKTGSTAAAAVMHATYNLLFFAAYILQWRDFPSQC